MMKNKVFRRLMCMIPYQYYVDEIDYAFDSLFRGYYTFTLYGHSVVYVHGKFNFVDNHGIGNLELWYVDPMIDETVAQCITFQTVDASHCCIMYDSKNPGHVKGMIVSDDTGKTSIDVSFTYVNDCDESFITNTVKRTVMNTRTLVELDNHFGRSISLINNMLPLEFFTTDLGIFDHTTANDSVYKLVPKLRFNYNNNDYNEQVTFLISFVKLDANHNYSSFEMAEKVFHDYGDYDISTGEINKKYLKNIIVNSKGITLTVNDKQVLKIDYFKRITKDEVKDSFDICKKVDCVTEVKTSNDKRTGVVKIITLRVTAWIDDVPLLKKHGEAFVNVIDCELDKDMMLRINTSINNSASLHIFDFRKCALLKIDKDDSGFKSVFVDFNDKKIYEVTYTK